MSPDVPSMGRRRSIVNLLIGEPATHTLENRVFNAAAIVTVLAGLASALVNLLTGRSAVQLVITLAAAVVAGIFYRLSITRNRERTLRVPLALLFVAVLAAAWLTNEGSRGSTPLFFFILAVGAVIIMDARTANVMLGLIGAAIAALLALERLAPALIEGYGSDSVRFTDVAVCLLLCLGVVTVLTRIVIREYQKERARAAALHAQTLRDKEALERAILEIRALRGILPVCSYCKKIKDEHDEWHTMEHYLSRHSDASVSHGLCPECARKNFPDVFPEERSR
jgi:hypothetical protein